MAAITSTHNPENAPVETLVERFRRLKEAWNKDTAHLSSMKKASDHQAYQEIIQLGPVMIPLLLRDLEETNEHWFIALSAITGAQPVPTAIAGDVPKMTEAWLAWGKDKGYRW